MKTLCELYRSPRREGMYLYVDKREGIERVPQSLLELFGKPQQVATLVMTPEKKLARADASQVLKEIGEQGYYLQLPPAADPGMNAIAVKNSKLPR